MFLKEQASVSLCDTRDSLVLVFRLNGTLTMAL